MQKHYLKIAILLLLTPILSIGQTLCNPSTNLAGIYPCKDYDLMGNIGVDVLTGSSNARGSDIWGWTDPLDNSEYAIIGMSNSTAFVNVTDPINPVFLGRINTANGNTSVWRDVKIYNNYAFIVADGVGNHGMQIFDLTKLRLGPDTIDFTYDQFNDGVLTYTGDGGPGDLVIESCHNIVINESEGVAYLVGCGANGGGPIFIDISQFTEDAISPTPSAIGDYSAAGYSHDAQVITYNGPDTDYTGKQIYIGSNGNNDKIVILDVTDKNNVINIAEFGYPETRYPHQGWFTDDHRYFILGDELDESFYGFNTKTLIFDFNELDLDFNDPAVLNPLLNIYTGTTPAIDHNGYVKGNEFFLANYRAGLRVLDVSTLTSTNNTNAEIGYFDTIPTSNSANFSGVWSIYPYFDSGNIIVSDIQGGLFIVRKSGTLGIDEFSLENSFSLSPNPTSSTATINSNNSQMINSVDIYNILGQKVFSKSNIQETTYVLPTESYSKGIYLIKINNSITKKLIIQ